jgi:uncharacterized protein (UPF0332 family)
MIFPFFLKAKENLTAARICFDAGLYNACANRAYYAALQAVIAALAHNGIHRDRIDHGGLDHCFGQCANRNGYSRLQPGLACSRGIHSLAGPAGDKSPAYKLNRPEGR